MRAGRLRLCAVNRIVSLALSLALVQPAVADDAIDSWVGGMLAAQTTAAPAAPVGLAADLSLSLSDMPDPAPVGSVVSYQANLDFSAPQPGTEGTSVQVIFFYTAGMVFQSGGGGGWSCSPGTVIQCSLASSLIAPDSTQFNLQFQMPATPQTVQLRGTASFVGATDTNPDNNTNITETTTVVEVGADLSLNVQAGASSVTAGDPVSYTAQVGNLGPGGIAGLTLVGSVSGPVSLNSLGGTGWACSNSATTFNCSYGPSLLAGNNTPVLNINATSGPGGGIAQLSATADAPDANAPVAGNASVSVTASGALSLSKTDSVDPVQLGEQFFYNLAVTNTGNSELSGLSLIDNLPTGLAFVAASGPGWSCSPASGGVQCSFASTLAAGATSTVRIDVEPLQVGTLVNTASVSDALGTIGADASESTTVIDLPQLSLSKRAERSQVRIGEELSFDLVVRNVGSSTATNLRLSDQIPAGLTLVGASGSGWSCTDSGGTVSCNRGSLAAGAESTVVIQTEVVGPPGPVLNVASLATDSADSQPLTDSATIIILAQEVRAPDLNLSKTTDVDPVNVEAQFNYLLTVNNNGGDATGITLTDPLPDGVSFIAASGAGWTCSGGQLVSCSFPGTLAAGGSTQLTLSVRAPATPGLLVNQASVSTPDEINTADNTASVSTTVVSDGGGGELQEADLELGGSVSTMSAAAGEVVSFSLLPRNNGPDAASATSLSGNAVRGIELLSAQGAGYSCQTTAGTFQCAGAALPVGAGPVLSVQARLTGAPGSSALLSAQVSGPQDDPAPGNNTVELQVAIEVPEPTGADLSLLKVASANPVEAGADFSYTLTVTNAGPAAATNVVLTDSLPAALEFLSVVGTGLSCNGGAVVSCQAATLASGASATVLINVRAPATAGDIQNTASVSSASPDPNPANNSASVSVSINERSAQSIEQELSALVVNDPTAAAAAGPVSELCADPAPAFAQQCRIILEASAAGDANAVSDALRAIAPDEVLGQTAAVLQLADRQFVNVDARLAELRGGAGGFSLSGLTVVSGGQAVPLSLFQGLFADDQMEVGGSGDLISPWGGFINGTISWGDQNLDRGNRNVTLDYDSYALTAGVDYRFSTRMVAGVALGYSNFDSKLTEQGEMTAKGLTLSGYGSWYFSDRAYVDGRLSYNRGDLDHVRFIRFGSGGDVIDLRATGSTDSSQLAIALGAGYHYNTGPWVITPSGFIRYIDVSVDGFSETGAGANSAIFGDQNVSTVQAGFGMSVTRAFSLRSGVISPQLDINFIHESSDDLRVQARLVGADPSIVFVLEPDEPDQSYGNIGLGFVYVTSNGRQAYLSYRETFGQDGLSSGTLNLGARFEF